MSIDSIPRRRFDALIIGAGGGGLRGALQLAEAEASVAVVSKSVSYSFSYSSSSGWYECCAGKCFTRQLALAYV